jgi:pimeloyl-ACP methyl ester carboxylesterase
LPQNYPTVLRLALGRSTPEEAEAAVLRMTSNRAQAHTGVTDRWVAARLQHPVSAVNAVRQLIAAARYRAPMRAPDVPLLLLASEHDQLVDSRCSQAIAGAWQCPLQMHPAAGHDLPLDDAGWVADQVSKWLSDTQSTRLT